MKVFGLLIDWVSANYQMTIWSGIRAGCRDRGVNLLTMVTGRHGSSARWELVSERLLRFIEGRHFDGFLILPATLKNTLGPGRSERLLRRISPYPMVSLGDPWESVPTVMVDNCTGFTELLEHLYGHGFRRFAYAGGPDTNRDARERRAVFLTFLSAKALEIRPDWVLDGTFSTAWGMESVARTVPGGRPDYDVLVCGNDDIAMGALEAFSLRNLQVPGDVAVTGFDDVLSSGQAGLTTVRQPLADLGHLAAGLLWDVTEGSSHSPLTIMRTEAVVRQTCGCLSVAARFAQAEPRPETVLPFVEWATADGENLLHELRREGLPSPHAAALVDSFLKAWGGEKQGFLHELQHLLSRMDREDLPPGMLHYPLSVIRRWVLHANETPARRAFTETAIHQARILLAEVLHTRSIRRETHQLLLKDLLNELSEGLTYSRNFAEQATVILDLFPKFGLGSFCLFLENHRLSPYPTPVLSHRGLGVEETPPQNEPWAILGQSLIDRNAPLGFLLLEVGEQAGALSVFDQLCDRITRGMATLRRIQDLEDQVALRTEELQSALRTLEENNVRLKDLTLRDELTGLYNRRGLLALAEHLLKAQARRGAPMALFYGDLDGLKIINDTQGHDAGDQAIRTAARMLLHTFRLEDVVARLGGDEFVILAPNCTPEDAASLVSRLARAFLQDGGEYTLSLGWISIDPKAGRSLADSMKEADEALYREKQARKPGQRR